MNRTIDLLCPNGVIRVLDYETQTLNECFINVALSIPSYTLFAILNGFTLGATHNIPRKLNHIAISLFRISSSILLALSISFNFAKYFLNLEGNDEKFETAAAPISSDLFQLFAFSLHTTILLNKNIFARYPISLFVSFFLVTITNLISLVNLIYLHRNEIQTDSLSEYLQLKIVYQVLFCAALVFYCVIALLSLTLRKCRVSRRRLSVNFGRERTGESSSDEDDYLVEGEEDRANYFSYMTFAWLKPVMKLG